MRTDVADPEFEIIDAGRRGAPYVRPRPPWLSISTTLPRRLAAARCRRTAIALGGESAPSYSVLGRAGVAKLVDAPDLDKDLSARGETRAVELLKFGEPCQMAIPSQARKREGVETRRAAPTPCIRRAR